MIRIVARTDNSAPQMIEIPSGSPDAEQRRHIHYALRLGYSAERLAEIFGIGLAHARLLKRTQT